MKRLARVLLYILAGLVGLVLVTAAVLLVLYPAEYVRRVLFYTEADVYDYQKFAERPIAAAPEPFHFSQPADPAAAAERVRAVFEQDPAMLGDLEQTLIETGTQAFIVIQDDEVLYEQYFNGAQRDSIVTSFSMAKSYVSTLVGIAIEEGLIGSIDDPITDYLPELAERDPRFAEISIRHLLNMTSGIHYVEYSFFTADDALTYYYPDLRRLALEKTRITGRPGEKWLYNNYHPLLLGLILERATGMPVAEYLEQKLWQRTGTEFPASWSLDSPETGFEKMESGLNARAIDFAKLGRLYLHGGNWEGEQVVPAEWVDAATHLDSAVNRTAFYPQEMGSVYGRSYHQLLWWGIELTGGGSSFSARGNHGQYLYVWPDKNLIIVRNGERYGRLDGLWVQVFTVFADQW